MDVSLRTSRLVSRLFRKPFAIVSYRNVTGTAVKEDNINTELLNSFNRDIKAGGAVPVFRRALLFPSRVALQDEVGVYTYAGLHQAAAALSQEISMQLLGVTAKTIAYMCNNDASHVIVQWAIWMSGNIAIPLTPIHPPDMIKFFLTDSMVSLVVCTQDYEKVLRPITLEVSAPLLITGKDKELTAQLYQPNSNSKQKADDNLTDVGRSNYFYGNTEAMIIYTSGTTSKPKGVVWTHSMLHTQIAALHAAWQYSCNDVVLHALPLHHIHGQLNSMLASLAAGARIRMMGSFVPHAMWARLVGVGERDEARVSVLHAVPAMLARLVAEHAKLFDAARTADYVRATLAPRLRLVCAGSAPLPEALADKWEKITGTRLLERYGMTEAGMALSNPYRPAEARARGVGLPLPGVAARVAAPSTLDPLATVETPPVDNQICLARLGLSPKGMLVEGQFGWQPPKVMKHKLTEDNVYEGELLLKGPGVFTRYWNRLAQLYPEDFTSDGWFRTGDTVSFTDKFTILGRTSVDIIKTGGYKVSALQVESAVLNHPGVADAAVIGIEDEVYGEIVGAVVVLNDKAKLTLQELKNEAGKKLAPYQLPRTMVITDQLPRNAMGKVNKKEIKKLFGKNLALKKP